MKHGNKQLINPKNMKKQLLIFVLAVFLGVSFLQSCSEDDSTTIPSEIVLGDTTFNLDNSNLYLAKKSTYRDWVYREYVITDGVLQPDKSHWDLENYDNATFFAVVQLAVREGDVETGEYPQYYSWSAATDDPTNMKISYVYLKTSENWYGSQKDNVSNNEPVLVSGGVNAGEEMSISLTSTFEKDGNEDTTIAISIKLKGIVNDATYN